MSLMSRSKFGSSSTFIDDSEVLFSSTTGSHGGRSDDVDAKSKWSSADGEEVTVMMRHQQIFLISLPQRDWLEHLRHIFFGVFHHGVLSHEVSNSRYQIRVYMCYRQPFVVSLSVP